MAKILLIDDDPVLLKLYSTKLTSDSHQVVVASNGEEGLAKLTQFNPQLIILDLLMPKINGFAFLKNLKANATTQKIPVIVFSSVANNEQIKRLKQLGVNTYLNKTDTTPTQLVTTINKLLGSAPPTTPPATPTPNPPPKQG